MRVQLSLKAEKLKNAEPLFKGRSDPYAIVRVPGGVHNGLEIGRTETLDDNLSPVWSIVFIFDYDPGEYVPIEVSIFDDNSDRNDDDRLMGVADFEIGEVLSSPGRQRVDKLNDGGKVTLCVDESVQGPDVDKQFALHLRGLDIKNVESGVLGIGRSDPFYEVSKKYIDPSCGIFRWTVVYRSKEQRDILNPFWEPIKIDMETLCNGDVEWPLRITVLDWQKKGKHRPIGFFDTNVKALIEGKAEKGNADREKAFCIYKEGKLDSQGFVCVLDAEICHP